MKKNVKLMITLLCVTALLVAGVTGCGLAGQGSDKPTDPTENTGAATEGTGSTKPGEDTKPSEGTEPSENNTEPSEGTEPGEGTEPSEDQTVPSEATQPSEGTEPTEPAPTEPPATEPAPTDPAPTEPVHTHNWLCGITEYTHWYACDCGATKSPVEHTFRVEGDQQICTVCGYAKAIQTPTNPAGSEEVGYKGVTPETMNEETTADWTEEDWIWYKAEFWGVMTPQQKYDYLVMSQNDGKYYRCGTEGHRCVTPREHEDRTNFVCKWCGKTECPAWVVDPEDLTQGYSKVYCPEYNELRDSSVYCQTCGKHVNNNEISLTETCNKRISDGNCYYCDVWVEAGACHTCKAEDVRPEFQHRVW